MSSLCGCSYVQLAIRTPTSDSKERICGAKRCVLGYEDPSDPISMVFCHIAFRVAKLSLQIRTSREAQRWLVLLSCVVETFREARFGGSNPIGSSRLPHMPKACFIRLDRSYGVDMIYCPSIREHNGRSWLLKYRYPSSASHVAALRTSCGHALRSWRSTYDTQQSSGRDSITTVPPSCQYPRLVRLLC